MSDRATVTLLVYSAQPYSDTAAIICFPMVFSWRHRWHKDDVYAGHNICDSDWSMELIEICMFVSKISWRDGLKALLARFVERVPAEAQAVPD